MAVTRLEKGHSGHAFPHFLPDGRSFLYYVTADPGTRGIYVGHVDGSPPQQLLDADAGGTYTNGHLFFIRQSKVFAQEFDAARFELKGSPFDVADGVLGGAGGLSLTMSAAAGSIAFRAGDARVGRQFAWVDRSGKLTPDGWRCARQARRHLTVTRSQPTGVLSTREYEVPISGCWTRGAASSLGLSTIPLKTSSRYGLVTEAGSFSRRTAPDVSRSIRKPRRPISAEEVLFTPREAGIVEVFPADTSPDGQWLLYQQRSAATGWDIWALPMNGDREPAAVVQTDADERGARLSPDGKWLAYVSNSSGPSEVFVQPFPGPGPSCRSPQRAETRSGGETVARNCSSSRWTAGSCRCRFESRRTTDRVDPRPCSSLHRARRPRRAHRPECGLRGDR